VCGRYVAPETAAIERAWQIGRTSGNQLGIRYNVAPTMPIQILRGNPASGELELVDARWGLIPGWWKDAKPPTSSHNARSEEAAAKPMWRQSYARARCLVPAAGWYEWRAAERADPTTGELKPYKQPHYIRRADERLVCFGGLMSLIVKDGVKQLTVAILTREAAPSVADVHDRMPVVIQDTVFARWLDAQVQNPDEVAMMVRNAASDFEHHPVTTRLNAAKTDEPEFANPI
jgi:putative SOS response-associated peptidase YedK